MKNEFIKNGDILFFNSKGFKRIFKGLNKTQAAIFLIIEGESVVSYFDGKKVIIQNFFTFNRDFNYISASPNWIKNPLKDVFIRLGWTGYSNTDQFIGELLGAKDYRNFKNGSCLNYCISNGWL